MNRRLAWARTHASYSAEDEAENVTCTPSRCASSFKQQIGEERRGAERVRQIDEQAERERVVDHRLADIEHAHAVAREDRRQTRRSGQDDRDR